MRLESGSTLCSTKKSSDFWRLAILNTDKVLSKLIEMQKERALMIDTAHLAEIGKGESAK